MTPRSSLLGIVSSQLRGFTTRWTVAGDTAARTITLPLVQNRAEGALAYNFTVKWGDGTSSLVTSYNDAARSHTYAADGTYDVEVRGTMEGWAFNNGGDRLKITRVVHWGDKPIFEGFKYLNTGFFGCSNLVSLGNAAIPASGTGVLTDGFAQTFRGCSSLTSLSKNLFSQHTQVTTSAFFFCFYDCTNLTSPPADLFRYNTLASTNAFVFTFYNCSSVQAIPVDFFRYNTLVSTDGFKSSFQDCFSLQTAPAGLFKYNTLASGDSFAGTFYRCINLVIGPYLFYDAGGESTRFLNQNVSFSNCFFRDSYGGPTIGTAPDLWNCDFGTGTPTKTACFGGGGNSLTSLSNFASIPVDWK